MIIGEQAFRISFINVQPAYEREAREYLRESAARDNIDSHTFTALGPFDLVVFNQTDSSFERYPQIQLLSAGIPLSGFMSILAYEFADPIFIPIRDVLLKPILLIASLKISNRLIEARGIEAENVFVQFCRHRIESVRNQQDLAATLLGSLGWYENVLVLGGTRIESLINFVIGLRRTIATEVDEALKLSRETVLSRHGKHLPVLETSFSIPCIDETKMVGPEIYGSQDIVDSRITVVCKPGMSTQVASMATVFFGTKAERRNPLGRGELTITARMPFGDLMSSLLEFRDKAGKWLIETETTIEVDLDKTETLPVPLPSKSTAAAHIRTRDFSYLANVDSYIHDTLQQVFTTLSGRMGSEVAADCFFDLVPFVADLARRIPKAKVDPDSLRAILEMCESYFYGLEQRFQGSCTSMAVANWLPDIKHEAGIQRILLAAEEVVRSVVMSSGRRWSGFCVFGLRDFFFRLEHGVINLPWDSLLRPNDWWQLFHEAGHEFAEAWKLEHNSQIKRLFEEYLSIRVSRLSDEAALRQSSSDILFFWELVSDLVDLYVGFGRNMKDYLKVTWGYLDGRWDSMERDEQTQQLLRMYFLFDAAGGKNERKRGALRSLTIFRSHWNRLPDQISRAVTLSRMTSIRQVCKSYAETAFYIVPKWVELHRYLQQEFDRSVIVPDLELQDVIDDVLRGQPCRVVQSPISLIMALALHERTGRGLSLQARIAAILSLWSTWRTRTPRQRIVRIYSAESSSARSGPVSKGIS